MPVAGRSGPALRSTHHSEPKPRPACPAVHARTSNALLGKPALASVRQPRQPAITACSALPGAPDEKRPDSNVISAKPHSVAAFFLAREGDSRQGCRFSLVPLFFALSVAPQADGTSPACRRGRTAENVGCVRDAPSLSRLKLSMSCRGRAAPGRRLRHGRARTPPPGRFATDLPGKRER